MWLKVEEGRLCKISDIDLQAIIADELSSTPDIMRSHNDFCYNCRTHSSKDSSQSCQGKLLLLASMRLLLNSEDSAFLLPSGLSASRIAAQALLNSIARVFLHSSVPL